MHLTKDAMQMKELYNYSKVDCQQTRRRETWFSVVVFPIYVCLSFTCITECCTVWPCSNNRIAGIFQAIFIMQIASWLYTIFYVHLCFVISVYYSTVHKLHVCLILNARKHPPLLPLKWMTKVAIRLHNRTHHKIQNNSWKIYSNIFPTS